MARSSSCISLVVCVLAAQHVAAQDVLTKMLATDVLMSGVKKDSIHSHLQRMLQIEAEREDLASHESCSPAALAQDKKCLVQSPSASKLSSKSSIKAASRNSVAAPNCEGRDCLVAPMPSDLAPAGSKAAVSAPQAPARKAATHGPMTQDAFARMVQRKRAALRAEIQKAGSRRDASAPQTASNDQQQLKDAFGIPLPAGPPRPRADFEMRFQPQTPSPDPAITTSAAPTTTTSDSDSVSTPTTAKSSTPRADFEMRFRPQTPAPDPNLFRNELEAFLAASPAPAPHRPARANGGSSSGSSNSGSGSSVRSFTATSEAATSQRDQPKTEQPKPQAAAGKSAASSGPARPPMTEQEAARLASQQAANTAAREAALARKRQMVRGEPTAVSSSSSSSKKNTTVAIASAAAASSSSRNNSTATTTRRINATSSSQQQQQQVGQRHAASSSSSASTSGTQQRRRTASSNTAGVATMWMVKRNPSSTTSSTTSKNTAAAAASSWSPLVGYLLSATLAVVSAAALFMVAAVMEADVTLDRLSGRAAGGGNWLSLTRGLWRRCRRAFAAARKQLTGHGSDLPLSANEGTGQLARTFAAASAFVHVFWTHLADHRGQHLGGAVTVAAAAAAACPFGASLCQQPESYVIEADTCAAVVATVDLNLRRRH